MQRVRISLKSAELQSLLFVQQYHLMNDNPVGFGNALMHEVLFEWSEDIRRRLNTGGKKFALTFTGSQAMAFMGFWGPRDLSHIPYERVIIIKILTEIHKIRANATIYTR